MKRKLLVLISVVILCCACVLGISACNKSPDYVGVYYAVNGERLNEQNSIEILDDGKWESDGQKGDYFIAGDSLVLIVNGTTVIVEMKDGVLDFGDMIYAKSVSDIPKDIVGEDDQDAPLVNEVFKLRKPTLYREGLTFKWEYVDSYAFEIKAKLNGEEIFKNEISGSYSDGYDSDKKLYIYKYEIQNPEIGVYTVELRAKGDGETCTNSDWVSISYTYTGIASDDKSPVAEYDVAKKELTFKDVKTATYYNIIVDGELVKANYIINETGEYANMKLTAADMDVDGWDIAKGEHVVQLIELSEKDGVAKASYEHEFYNPYIKKPKIEYFRDEDQRLILIVYWDSEYDGMNMRSWVYTSDDKQVCGQNFFEKESVIDGKDVSYIVVSSLHYTIDDPTTLKVVFYDKECNYLCTVPVNPTLRAE